MKFLNKSPLSLFVAAALGGAVMMGSTNALAAYKLPAAPAGLNNNTGTLAAGKTLYVSEDGLGQAHIVPYFKLNDGFRTNFTLTNTSGDTLAVKVIIHEGEGSRDALNFWVILSPYDVWPALVSTGPNGPQLFRPDDKTCIVGAFIDENGDYDPDAQIQSIPPKGQTVKGNLNEGYITTIVGGKLDPAKYKEGVEAAAKNCSAMNNLFVAENASSEAFLEAYINEDYNYNPTTDPSINIHGSKKLADAFLPLEDGDNPVRLHYAVIDAKQNTSGGGDAVAIANFNQTDGDDHLVSAQSPIWFEEPTMASADGLWTDTGLDAMAAALSTNRFIQEWNNSSDADGRNEMTDWVITFPLKVFHQDGGKDSGYYMNNWRIGKPTANLYADRFYLYPFDRDENHLDGNPVPSPGGVDPYKLENEVNVISFYTIGQSNLDTPLRSELNAHNFDLLTEFALDDVDGVKGGWGMVNFRGGVDGTPRARSTALGDKPTPYFTGSEVLTPMVGMMFKTRTDPVSNTQNYGQLYEHVIVSNCEVVSGRTEKDGSCVVK